MRRGKSHIPKTIAAGITSLLLLISCDGVINEDYDLSKDIDMTVSGLQGADVPLGNFKEISVADLFGFGSGDKGVVYPDYDGNYILEHTVKGELSVPSPDIDLTSLQFRDLFDPIEATLPVTTGDIPFSFTSEMHFEIGFPEYVTDVKSVDIYTWGSNIQLTLRSDNDNVYVKSGFRIIFPEYIHLEDPFAYMDVEDGHILVCNKDNSLPAWLTFSIARIDLPEGAYTDGKLVLNPEVRIEGELGFRTDYMEELPEDVLFTLKAELKHIALSGAEMKGVAEFELDDIEGIKIENVPEFFSDDKCVLDIYDPSIYLSIDNDFQFTIGAQAALTAYDSIDQPTTLNIGNDSVVVADPESKPWYVYSCRKKELAEGLTNVVDPVLSEMFIKLPESFCVNDIKVKLGSAEHLQKFQFGNTPYTYTLPYYLRFSLPLSFGERFRLYLSRDVEIAEIDFDVPTDSVELSMDVVNSIPLKFITRVWALDSEGYPIYWLDATSDDYTIASGTQDSPVTTNMTWKISTERNYVKFSGIRILCNPIAASEEHLGVPLNKKQKIELRNLTLHLPDGITIDPDAL